MHKILSGIAYMFIPLEKKMSSLDRRAMGKKRTIYPAGGSIFDLAGNNLQNSFRYHKCIYAKLIKMIFAEQRKAFNEIMFPVHLEILSVLSFRYFCSNCEAVYIFLFYQYSCYYCFNSRNY